MEEEREGDGGGSVGGGRGRELKGVRRVRVNPPRNLIEMCHRILSDGNGNSPY